ncbi:MAG: DUF3500 domain-containing protein [Chitinophagaceae bacterium]
MPRTFRILILLLLSCSSGAYAQQEKNISQLANQFLNSLDSSERLKAFYPFESDERYNFHFVPRDDRKGISVNELSGPQKEVIFHLLKICLSADGYSKANNIMQHEKILKAIEKRKADDHYRDTGKYFITIFGIPAAQTTWGWRIEGHHVSLNFSARNNRLRAVTPGFFGSNPGVVPDGPQKGKEILKQETDVGFALVRSLSGKSLENATIDSIAPADIFTFDKRIAMIDHPGGLSYALMTDKQKELMLAAIRVYVHRYTKLFADEMFKEIQKSGLDKIRFSWAGSTVGGLGHPHYYRIQGPTFLIEYDNIQNNANHVHSVLRDLRYDFGGDELLDHYLREHVKRR